MRSDTYGFTLIEILIAMAILGVMGSLMTGNFMNSYLRARDAVRKNDLRQLQNALESFKADSSSPISYPASIPACGSAWTVGSTTYMAKIPCDPKTNSGYSYQLGASSVLTYTLCTCLEILDDAAGVRGDCDASYVCPGSPNGNAYTITQP